MKTISTIIYIKVVGLLSFILFSQTTFAHWGSKGPYGASVSAMITVDTNVYIGTYSGGVFRSNNKSLLSWVVKNNGLGSGYITSFTNIGTVIYAGTADDGVYKSTDVGTNWTKVSTGLTDLNVYALTVSGTTLFAGTKAGVFKSLDNGANWTSINTGLINLNVNALVASASNVYAGTEAGVFVTSDASNWTAVNTNLTELNINTLAVNGIMIYAGTDAGLFSSPQTSVSWTLENSGLNTVEILGLYSLNGTLYAGTYSGLYSSSDAAALSWTAQNTGGLEDDTVIAVTSYNNKLMAGTYDQGLFKSNVSPISWAAFNSGVNNLNTNTFFAEGSLIISATNWGVYVSRDIAASYTRANNGLTDSLNVSSLLFVGSTLYAATGYGGVFVSADTGRHWTSVNTGLTNLNVQYILSYNNQLITVSPDGDLFISPSASVNWTSIPAVFPSSSDITGALVNGLNLYVSTLGDGVFVFNGTNWSSANTGLTNTQVTDIKVHGSNLFVSTLGGGVFVSPVLAINWTASNSGLPSLEVYSLGVLGQYVIVGLKGMVYASYDDVQTWLPTNVQLNLPSFSNIIGIGFTSARVFVSTPDNSLYSNAQSELPLIPTSVLNPASSTRSANEVLLFPNPSQGNVSIEFVLLDEKMINITLFDLSGKLIRETAETNRIEGLERGVYIITIVTNKGTSTQKLFVR